MTRITVAPPLYINTDSEDHHSGYDLALEVWFATGEGKSKQDAATLFAEVMMQAALTESTEALAAKLHGAAQFMLEVMPTPEIREAPMPTQVDDGRARAAAADAAAKASMLKTWRERGAVQAVQREVAAQIKDGSGPAWTAAKPDGQE